jgi:hypothetical protein
VLERAGEPAEQQVAAEMPEVVVVGLEAVEVEQQQPHGAILGRFRPDVVQILGELPAVGEAGERVDRGLATLMELGGLERPHDRDDGDQQRERRQDGHGIVKRRARVHAERDREDQSNRQHQPRDHDLRAKARRDHSRRQHQPRQRGAARPAAEDDAGGEQRERAQDRADADALGM